MTSTTLDRARQIVQHAHAISPSASLLRLEQQLRQGDSNARQLAKLIDGSPALAARVLRMANSAFYAPAEPVTTLSRAVALLGDTVLRQLVLTSLIVSRRAGNRSPREALAAARLTGDAVRAAVVGKILAQMSRAADPDTAFAAGLLHDLGHVYLLDDVGERYASYLLDPHAHDARNAAGQLEMEIELAGTTHQDVGAVFAYEWNLPPVIARVLWDHHVPSPGIAGCPGRRGRRARPRAELPGRRRRRRSPDGRRRGPVSAGHHPRALGRANGHRPRASSRSCSRSSTSRPASPTPRRRTSSSRLAPGRVRLPVQLGIPAALLEEMAHRPAGPAPW